LDYWIIRTLETNNAPGLTQIIKIIFKATDGINNYFFDINNVLIPTSDVGFNLTSSGANVNLTVGNILGGGTNIAFNSNEYTNHTIYANFVNNESISLTVEFHRSNTNTNIILSQNSSKIGESIYINVVVYDENSNLPINIGFVEFFINNNSVANVSVSNGKANYKWLVNLANGDYSLGAIYHGTDYLSDSEDSTLFSVLTIYTNVSSTWSIDSPAKGDTVTITAYVTLSNAGAMGGINVVNSGVVNFYINNRFIGTVIVINGVASIKWVVDLNAGQYNIKSEYIGVDSFISSSNDKSFNVVNLATNLIVSNHDSNYGDVVQLRATLKDSRGNPLSGHTVDFYVNGIFIGSGTTNIEGIATFNHRTTATGSLSFQVKFNSAGVYLASNNFATLNVPKHSVLSVKNSKSVKKGNVILKTILANLGPDVSSKFKITFKLPKGFIYKKPKVSIGKVSYNKKTRVLIWTVNLLKVSKSNSASLTWSMKAKKGKYTIAPKVDSVNSLKVKNNNILKKFKV
jgi:hypothetical protein